MTYILIQMQKRISHKRFKSLAKEQSQSTISHDLLRGILNFSPGALMANYRSSYTGESSFRDQ